MKQFLLGICLVACISAMAQINHPLVEEGKIWYYTGSASYVDDRTEVWDETYSLEGDTVIGSHQCMKLYHTSTRPRKSYNHAYIGAMYEKNEKVYYIAPNNTTSAILYDFSCDVGDIVKMDEYDIYSYTGVVKWDEIKLNINDKQLVKYHDDYLTVMNWSPFYNDESIDDFCTIWIEGVGSPLDLLNSAPVWNTGGSFSKKLLKCKLNDRIIYERNEFMEYYPAPEQRCFTTGTKWTEIRLDTLKYDNWYSKVGDEWVPNYEAMEYYVKLQNFGFEGKASDYVLIYHVYTNGPEWSDSLAFALYERHTTEDVCLNVVAHSSSAQAYQFNWYEGKELYYQNIVPFISSAKYPYGTIEEIKEGNFGGVKPLKYVDLNGVRIIQGIGVTEWNDGECLFGPVNLYRYSSSQGTPSERHYRSMLVHFERDGEVLYNVWPEKETTSPVTFTTSQMATIILPTEPDAGKGKYYRLDRVEAGQIVFEQELQPRAHVPYIIVPFEDFSIDPGQLELEGLKPDTVSVDGISFIGTYSSEKLESKEDFHIEIIDATPDCSALPAEGQEVKIHVGTLRAYLTWHDPYNPGGSKGPEEELQIVLHDHGTGILSPAPSPEGEGRKNAAIYDLSGKKVNGKWLNGKSPKGIYIKDRKKWVLQH